MFDLSFDDLMQYTSHTYNTWYSIMVQSMQLDSFLAHKLPVAKATGNSNQQLYLDVWLNSRKLAFPNIIIVSSTF